MSKSSKYFNANPIKPWVARDKVFGVFSWTYIYIIFKRLYRIRDGNTG